MPTEYPVEFKQKVIQRYEKGESIKELSQELNIAQSTIYHWRKMCCSLQTPQRTYTPKEFGAISRQLEKLGMRWRSSKLPGTLRRFHYSESLKCLSSCTEQKNLVQRT